MKPLITIGTPFYNSGWCFKDYVKGILNFSYPKEKTELIFMYSESTDDTLQLLKEFKEKHDDKYVSILIDSCPRDYWSPLVNSLLFKPFVKSEKQHRRVKNIARARNRIIQNKCSNTDLVFIDSDTVPPFDGIERLLKMTEPPYYADICGGIYIAPSINYMAEFGNYTKLEIAKLCQTTNPIGAFHRLMKKVNALSFFLKFNARGELTPILSFNNMLSLPSELCNRILKVEACGFGFVLIKNRVLEQQEDRWIEEDEIKRGIFAEDLYFCVQARKSGFKILVDTSLWCDHLHWNYDKIKTLNGLKIVLKGINPKREE